MATIEERLIDLETKYAAHENKFQKAEVFIKKFIKIKQMVVRKSESGRIQLRDVE